MNKKSIKRYLSTKIGEKIIVIYYGSRNRKERYEGKIVRAYDNIFIIQLPNYEIKSFTYVDILIKTVRIYI